MTDDGAENGPFGDVSERPSIGFVVRADPSAPTGASARVVSTLRSLQANGDVVLYVLATTEPVQRTAPSQVWIPMCGRRLLPHDYLAALVGWRPRRLMAGQPGRQRKICGDVIAGSHDVIWAYSARAFLSLPMECRRTSRVIVDLVDLEDQRDIAVARTSVRQAALRTLLAKLDGRALRRTLRSIAATADHTVISSDTDRRRLGAPGVSVLPNTFDLRSDPVGNPDRVGSPTYLFVGFLHYGPNVDALHWLIEHIWPAVVHRRADAQLRVVGKGLAPGALDAVAGVTIVGEVADVTDELRRATATLAPLRIGSGTRVKIIEGWAHRVPVISTSVGADGLDCDAGVHLVVADSVEDFAEAMVRVADDVELRRLLARNGEHLWRERYSQDTLDACVVDVLDSADAFGSHDGAAGGR